MPSNRMLHTEENLRAALEMISRGILRPTKIAKGLGIAYRTYCSWMLRSNRGDEAFLIEFNGEVIQFAKAAGICKRLAMIELRTMLEQYSIFGREEISCVDGRPVYQIEPATIDWSPDEREALGFRRDGLKVGPEGLPMVQTQHKMAPIQLQLRLLEATFKDMRPHTTTDVNVNGQLGVGIGMMPKATYTGAPPPLLAEPEVPMIEDSSAIDAEFNEVEEVKEFNEVEEEDEAPAPSPIVIAPQITVNTDRLIEDTDPAREHVPESSIAFTALPQRAPRSPLEADLMEKLAAARNRGATV